MWAREHPSVATARASWVAPVNSRGWPAIERESRAAPPRAEAGRNTLGRPGNDDDSGMDSVEVVLAMLLAVVASAYWVRAVSFPLPLPLMQIALGAAKAG